MLVGALRIVLLGLEERMVEVHVIRLPRNELARGDKKPHQQFVKPRCSVEVVGVARLLSSVADVLRGKLADAAKNGVGTRNAGMRTINKVVLQMRVQVFHGISAAEENTDDGTYDLAVLVAYRSTAKTQERVYLAAKICVIFVQNEIYSTVRGDFLRFLLYLCHVIDEIQLLCFCSTKVSEISDMTKS